MSRLQSARRDYAIAGLASGDPSGAVPLHEDVARGVVAALAWGTPGRLVRARVALFLRLERRAEAWERGGWMPCRWALAPGRYTGPGASGMVAKWPACSPIDWVEWRPLWLSAPSWDPGITPAMRRSR